jgi:hypothetical protein
MQTVTQATASGVWDRPPEELPNAAAFPSWGALRECIVAACHSVSISDCESVTDAFMIEIVRMRPPRLSTLVGVLCCQYPLDITETGQYEDAACEHGPRQELSWKCSCHAAAQTHNADRHGGCLFCCQVPWVSRKTKKNDDNVPCEHAQWPF